MKPLFHPAIEDVPVETILHALADPVQVALFTEVIARECAQNCTGLVGMLGTPIPKSTLSQHMRNVSRCAEIEVRYPGLIRSIVTAHAIQNEARKKESRRRSRRTAGV